MANKYTDAVHLLTGLKPTSKAVLTALAHFTDNDNGKCWPSVSTICTRCGFKRTAVKQALTELREHGIIKVVGQKQVSTGAINIYQISQEILRPGWKTTRSGDNLGRETAVTGARDDRDQVARRPQNSSVNSSSNSSQTGADAHGCSLTDTTFTKFGMVGSTPLTWVAITELIHSCTGMPYIRPVDPLLPLLVRLSEEALVQKLQSSLYLYAADNDEGEVIKPGDPRFPGPDTSWPPGTQYSSTLRELSVGLTWTKFNFATETLEVLAQYLPLERPNSEVPEGMIEFREEDVLTMIRAYGWPSSGFLEGELGELDLSLAYIAAVAQWAFKKSDYWPARLKTVQDFIKRFPTLQQQYDRYYANLSEGKKPHELGCGLPKE